MSVNIDISGKTALITGATHGIGNAIAKVFKEAGADLILTGTNPVDIEQLNEKESEKLTLHSDYKNNRFLASLNYRSDMLLPYKSKIKDLEEKYWDRKGGIHD